MRKNCVNFNLLKWHDTNYGTIRGHTLKTSDQNALSYRGGIPQFDTAKSAALYIVPHFRAIRVLE